MFGILLLSLLSPARGQVTATGPNGATNPAQPSFAAVGSSVNGNSISRLVSLNSVDDFCLYAPASTGPDNTIGNLEAEVVAYCTKPRNGARLIPDGTIQSAHFIKTPMYVQIYGLWDGTRVNIMNGDYGGELDPHGATGLGNPIGGNVTSNVSGRDVFYEEWMQFVAYDQFCFRICTAQNSTVSAADQCQHTLDLMGCSFVMAIPDLYNAANAFTSCQGDPAAPPGLYPLANGSTSTFAQRYTGTYTQSGTLASFTVGQTVTPAAPAFYPATSNCVAFPTISNGIANGVVNAQPTTLTGGSSYQAVAPAQPTTNSSTSAASTAASSSSATVTSTSGMTTAVSSTSGSQSAAASTSKAASQKTAGFESLVPLTGCLVAGIFGMLLIL